MCFASPGSSIQSYTRGSFTHQLNKELDSIRNQRNKLGKYLHGVTGYMWAYEPGGLILQILLTGCYFLLICLNFLIWTWTRTA